MIGRATPCDEGVIASTKIAGGCPRRSKPWVLAATILGSSMAFIDGAAVSVALPVIQTELAASFSTMQWVVNSYTLLLAALMLIGGSAGDHFGRRWIFVAGVVIFAAASVACGLSANAWHLVAARALQGIGGACLIPNSLAIIGATFDDEEKGRAIGTWAGFSAIAGAIGPVLGGWLVDAIGWQAIFFVNVPIALATVLIAARHMPETRDRGAVAALDWRGAFLAACGLGALAFGLIQAGTLGWRDPVVVGALIASALVLFGFVWVEARGAAPMMPLGFFRSRTFSGVNLLTLLLYAALGGVLFFLPFNLIQVRGYSASQAGAAFLPFTIIMGVLSRWSGGLRDRFGARRPLIFGPVIAAIGLALLVLPGLGGSYWTGFFVPMVVLGLGMAVTVAPLTTAVMGAVPPDRSGVASGINNAVARVATLLAVASFGTIGMAFFSHVLAGQAAMLDLGPEAARALGVLGQSLTGVVLPPDIPASDRAALETAIRTSFLSSFRLLMLIAAGLALAGSLCAAFTVDSNGERQRGAGPGAPASG